MHLHQRNLAQRLLRQQVQQGFTFFGDLTAKSAAEKHLATLDASYYHDLSKLVDSPQPSELAGAHSVLFEAVDFGNYLLETDE